MESKWCIKIPVHIELYDSLEASTEYDFLSTSLYFSLRLNNDLKKRHFHLNELTSAEARLIN